MNWTTPVVGVKGTCPLFPPEPTTLRLTAEWLIVASRCKHNYLDALNADSKGIWGDSGGTGIMCCEGIFGLPDRGKKDGELCVNAA